MKYKTTQKAVKQGYEKIIYTGYCNLQNLLNYENPVAYTTRREGWGADVYDFGAIAIVTGYAPFGNIHVDYDICQKYDNAAEKLRYFTNEEWELTKKLNNFEEVWEDKQRQIKQLINEFIQEVTA